MEKKEQMINKLKKKYEDSNACSERTKIVDKGKIEQVKQVFEQR